VDWSWIGDGGGPIERVQNMNWVSRVGVKEERKRLVTREPLPGPASLAGLAWLARVGPAPVEAWRSAMGWSLSVAGSHARRLEREGWLGRHRMTRGQGSLLVATRRGVRMSGLAVSAPAAPAPTWWAHDCACAWTAAWLAARGREWRGPREVLTDPRLKGELEWITGNGRRRAGHRPDLAVVMPTGMVAIEVELQRKADNRLRAILRLYGQWLSERRITGLIYVCRDEAGGARIRESGAAAGLPEGGLRVELLSTVQAQAQGRSA